MSSSKKKEVIFLGHMITPHGVKPNPDKKQGNKAIPSTETSEGNKIISGTFGILLKFH